LSPFLLLLCERHAPALAYLTARALGAPAETVWLVVNGIFRGLGDTVRGREAGFVVHFILMEGPFPSSWTPTRAPFVVFFFGVFVVVYIFLKKACCSVCLFSRWRLPLR
jgi:hypothetical protein